MSDGTDDSIFPKTKFFFDMKSGRWRQREWGAFCDVLGCFGYVGSRA